MNNQSLYTTLASLMEALERSKASGDVKAFSKLMPQITAILKQLEAK